MQGTGLWLPVMLHLKAHCYSTQLRTSLIGTIINFTMVLNLDINARMGLKTSISVFQIDIRIIVVAEHDILQINEHCHFSLSNILAYLYGCAQNPFASGCLACGHKSFQRMAMYDC